MATITITKVPDLMLREMAADWVAGRVFSEKHVNPYTRENVNAVFPSSVEAMEDFDNAKEIREKCGMIFSMMDMAIPGRTVQIMERGHPPRVYRVFQTCIFLHKDQLEPLQKMIEEERRLQKWKTGNHGN